MSPPKFIVIVLFAVFCGAVAPAAAFFAAAFVTGGNAYILCISWGFILFLVIGAIAGGPWEADTPTTGGDE